jgi:hypothetical protein
MKLTNDKHQLVQIAYVPNLIQTRQQTWEGRIANHMEKETQGEFSKLDEEI